MIRGSDFVKKYLVKNVQRKGQMRRYGWEGTKPKMGRNRW